MTTWKENRLQDIKNYFNTVENTLQKIRAIFPLSTEELVFFQRALQPVHFKKGNHLFHEGTIGRHFYFIERGLARAYCQGDPQEVTFWFGEEGDVVFSYRSYIFGQPGYESIELLEDSFLYRIPYQTLHQLYGVSVSFSNWGRKLAEEELIRTEQRLLERQMGSAQARYEQLIKKQPSILKRVQLQYIASYLGVTGVTLSRIRTGKRAG